MVTTDHEELSAIDLVVSIITIIIREVLDLSLFSYKYYTNATGCMDILYNGCFINFYVCNLLGEEVLLRVLVCVHSRAAVALQLVHK